MTAMAHGDTDIGNDDTTTPATNGTTIDDKPAKQRSRHGSEADAQEMVIASLRSQIQDLYSQVTQLNNKLVSSYDRVSDLEDELHVTSTNLRSSSLKVNQLEAERTQHLSALNTGLLVEKSNVTAELNRLMEKATEEAAQRGQAETARAAIEKDLDDLSASLFDQANTMVAEARYSKFLSERKVEEAEVALKGAEEAVTSMQHQMQALYVEKEDAQRAAEEMRVSMGKGKWVERRLSAQISPTKLISSHLPYHEFLLFVAHLRTLHISTSTAPTMSTLLPLPFVSRLATEDSEPTLRLDLAPSLNWLSRRSVLSAIHHGQLTIEPVSSHLVHQEVFLSNSGNNSNGLACALCGEPVFPSAGARAMQTDPGSWSTSLLKSINMNGVVSHSSPNPVSHPPVLPDSAPSQVYVFKVTSPSALPSSTLHNISLSLPQGFSPSSSHSPTPQSPTRSSQLQSQSPQPTPSTIYPLCPNGWCLNRLRQTCTLWAFVRTGIVEKIWEEEVPDLPVPPVHGGTAEKAGSVPPKRGLWGALTERASSWTAEKEKKKVLTEKEERDKGLEDRMKEKEKELFAKSASTKTEKAPPPPVHPTMKTTRQIYAPKPIVGGAAPPPPPPPRRSEARRMPPHPVEDGTQSTRSSMDAASVPLPESRPATPASPTAPPPLPRRAAARRPLSMAIGSRPGTPSQLAQVGHAKDEGVREEAVVERKTVEEDKSGEGKVEAGKVEADKVEEGKIEESVEEAKAVDDKEAVGELAVASVEQKADTVEVETEAAAKQDTDAAPSAETELSVASDEETHAVVDDAQDAVPAVLEPEPATGPPPLPRRAPRAPPVQYSEGFNTPPEGLSDAEVEDDEEPQGLYIGDATWEERTWKEIVKLKEELFWARVGGVR